MVPWIVTALKAVLPHIGTIIQAAAPVFTKKDANASADQALLLKQQITELQLASSQNSTHIKELAAQLRNTVTTLEKAASIAETKLQRALLFCLSATIFSLFSIGVVLSYIYWR